ncbi:MAG: hypothetical protein A2498_05010 [Lentisphaerae bacterium RIFOXYC12_FULL_60_16]|nr:MAG: hypothetical protein A2498_05010 [Lentisphaerae bacterium RIFOXYC12_FULL_60_16]OGV72462.1 MAG: hypothetical protein A2269_03000 [Lentisphaerae bacterium RIFOXYA12_FULL_60_10]OGV86136.1 MAG: hypothetical protein A2340_02450 [Lentisphaerae bacterium RIFOXYB12_FULL_60_10]
MRIKPFDALRPDAALVDRVAAVPYDTVNTEEARELARGNPRSLLHVTRPEINCPDGTDPHADALYRQAAQRFRGMVQDRTLVHEGRPCLYVYRQIMGSHVQRGLVGCCHIDDYVQNRIVRHEKTRQDKEDDRTRHLQALGAQVGPVFLMYRDVPAVDRLVTRIEAGTPLYDFKAPDEIRHTVWRAPVVPELLAAMAPVPAFYIADGHHRAAAAVRAGLEWRRTNPAHTGDEPYNWMLAVMFPASQLQILPYHRVVRDLNGLSVHEFLDKVRSRMRVAAGGAPVPSGPGRASLFVGGAWYALEWDRPDVSNPQDALDVSVLSREILDPILGIRDIRNDVRIDFIGGIRGTPALEERVCSGRAAVAFSLYPVTVDSVMAVADAGQIMPPKSTWFEPKLRSGLLIHPVTEQGAMPTT